MFNNNNNNNTLFEVKNKELKKFFSELDQSHNLPEGLGRYFHRLKLDEEIKVTRSIKTYVSKIVKDFDERQQESTWEKDLTSLLRAISIFLKEASKIKREGNKYYGTQLQTIYRSLLRPKVIKKVKWAAYEGQKAIYRGGGRKRKLEVDKNTMTVARRKKTKERENNEEVKTLFERMYEAQYGVPWKSVRTE